MQSAPRQKPAAPSAKFTRHPPLPQNDTLIIVDDSDDDEPSPAPKIKTTPPRLGVVYDLDDDVRIVSRPRPAMNPNPAIVIVGDSDDDGCTAKSGKLKAAPRRIAPTSFAFTFALPPLPSIASLPYSSSSSSASSSSSSAPPSPSSAPSFATQTASLHPGRRLTAAERAILEAAFTHNQFPSEMQRGELARQVGVSPERMRTWFNNRRGLWRKENNIPAARRFPEEVTTVLQTRFAQNSAPSREVQMAIAMETGLTFVQVRSW
ncbi:hypothetical protein B0H17DRAFT_1195794 [Mycena rosella]|uniref:Homeobox domain-containing protein n=1 Tax=Mycena rosella TaxID=1033263 RepID=A0AAD7DUZ7_MYCRO|nr:hypothetical protein B0H17DRAFT_1195794 [Mycena rosella]